MNNSHLVYPKVRSAQLNQAISVDCIHHMSDIHTKKNKGTVVKLRYMNQVPRPIISF